ncbi:hypothetical protein AXG93_107s1250 [Marchantia polymorpha subsp. ruderalis]|uniref:Uncharacterized protein n=1 Tax=Marchantia polymorpha subsp. ruderalis TaxID=1480154 RepID=A0A176WK85_MARPO|nr:hypothetical protein AXG93_107s1250 [Marchantia polymorpha subsp. ruderalis]
MEFSLESEIVASKDEVALGVNEIVASKDEVALGVNEIVSEDDDVELAQLSAKVDILDDDDVEEPPAKRPRRVVTPSASKDVVPVEVEVAGTEEARTWEWLPLDVTKERHMEEVEFDRGEETSACEPKPGEMSMSDLLSEQIVPLMKYLNMKMARLVETEAIIGRLDQEIDAGLRARVEPCLRGYVDYEIQITK